MESLQAKAERLRKELEETEKALKENTLEVGKWYNRQGGELLVWNDGKETYGFTSSGGWSDYLLCSCLPGATTATDKEVKEALIKEAKRKGFKNGAKYRNYLGSTGIIKESCFEFRNGHLSQVDNVGGNNVHFIFEDGKWAEIISKPELPEIEGYKGEDEGNFLKYGCAEIPKEWFQMMNGNRQIASFKLTNGVKFSTEHVEQIKEYLKN